MGRKRTGNAPLAETDGLCACGCGQETPTSNRYQEKNGVYYRKGQHFTYCPGHGGRPAEDRFWANVDKREPDECWPWLGGFRNGYGRLSIDNQSVSMHIFSYELANGARPEGAWILHRCGNKKCVNPAHLYAGNPSDNNKDTVVHGHSNPLRGSDCPTAKLSESKVVAIRSLYASGNETMQSIADRYNVSLTTVCNVVHRRTWKHI